jgi:SAM-dependent methyltransferase
LAVRCHDVGVTAAATTTATEAILRGKGARPVDRRELILRTCAGRDVLDCGAIQHSWRMSVENPGWLHAAVREVARSCVGVDFLVDDVRELHERGYDMRFGNVLTDPPPGQFDVVVAGDIIEHLEDPGVFLRYIADALRPDGVAVITTPSAFYIGQWWTLLAKGRPAISPEHSVLFDPFTFIKLVDRSPLEVVELHWLTPSWWALWDSNLLVRNIIGRSLHAVSKLVLRLRPYLNSDFGVVLRRRPEGWQRDVNRSAADVMAYLGHQG